MSNLDTTRSYARLYDRTLAKDYYAAMEQVEKRPEAAPPHMKDGANLRGNGDDHAQLLELAAQLAEPELDIEGHLDPVDQLCRMSIRSTSQLKKRLMKNENERQLTTWVNSLYTGLLGTSEGQRHLTGH